MKAKRRRRRRNPNSSTPPPPFNFAELIGAILGEVFPEFKMERAVNTTIPPDMMKKLLFLCHPDKHNNHTFATEVTRWLLEIRETQNPKKKENPCPKS